MTDQETSIRRHHEGLQNGKLTKFESEPMKSIVTYFYEGSDRLNDSDSPLFVEGELVGFVRAEILNERALHALDVATPRPYETVLNSVELSK